MNEYRSRAFTKGEDRVIAFAAIARAVQNVTQLTYLAGLWAEHFPGALTWYHKGGLPGVPLSAGATIAERPVKDTAPTWSWF